MLFEIITAQVAEAMSEMACTKCGKIGTQCNPKCGGADFKHRRDYTLNSIGVVCPCASEWGGAGRRTSGSVCEKGAQWQKQLASLSEIADRLVIPNIGSWNAAISACDRAKQWETAFGLLREMAHQQLAPTVVSWRSVINACDKAEQ